MRRPRNLARSNGDYAIVSGTEATIASILILGAAIFVAGIVQIAGAFAARGAGHVILALLVGALDVVVGLMLMQHPGAGALYRFVLELWLQFPFYGFAGTAWSALG